MGFSDLALRAVTDSSSELLRALPFAIAEYVEAAIENPSFGREHALALLKKRTLERGILRRLAFDPRFANDPAIASRLVIHPRTPIALSSNLVQRLPWREIVRAGGNPILSAGLRRLCEATIIGRIGSMAEGERISLARLAPPALHAEIMRRGGVRVMRALFSNPRFAEASLIAILNDTACPAEVLAAITGNLSGHGNRAIRIAAIGHPKTPITDALRSLETLSTGELEEIRSGRSVRTLLRVGAERSLRRRADSPVPGRSARPWAQ